tara:strand:- start:1736 stop:1939 length:204 start_codon:yes stop_codon:yes gene_type:complete
MWDDDDDFQGLFEEEQEAAEELEQMEAAFSDLYADFECMSCGASVPHEDLVVEDLGDDVRFFCPNCG